MHLQSSKFLALILRHKPEEIGIVPDPQGWAEIDDLLVRMAAAGRSMSRADLMMIVATSDKKRFSVSEDGLRIRAAQGHSIEVDLGLTPARPPEVLYHGTAEDSLPSIKEHGLRPGARQHVHLSHDIETAHNVGRRHGAPVVLSFRARQLSENGHTFYQAENGVWLTNRIPSGLLRVCR